MKKSASWIAFGIALTTSYSAYAAEKVNLSSTPNNLKNINLNSSVEQQTQLMQQLNLDNNYQLLAKSTNVDIAGNLHSRYKQLYQGIPVWGYEVITHHSKKTTKTHLSGQVIKKIENDLGTQINPKLSNAEIISQIKSKIVTKVGAINQYRKNNAELIIFFDEKFAKAKLAYQVEILADAASGEPVRHMFIVDANNGFVYKNWNALMHIDAVGPGGNTKTGRYEYGTDYEAMDVADLGGGQCALENSNVKAIDLNNTTNTGITTAFEFTCPENTYKEINGAYSPINDAYYFGNVTFNMYQDWYNTAPLPFQLSMKVHYSNNYENAFWDGSAMTFGDGLNTFFPLVDLNVSVHEVSHGFTEFNSNLVYASESGGMNEAFSDIAGEAGEYYWKGSVDWFVGRDIMKNGDGLRFFEDPTQDGISISHYSQYYEGMDVHHSSGLYNRAYYLLSNKEGWDPRKAFDIFVLANQSYWTENSTFAEGACGLISSAFDLDYSWFDVYDALKTVGVECTGNSIDVDVDGISDLSELIYGFDSDNPKDAILDFDSDGISNRVEINTGSDPKSRDSDNDGVTDGDELLVYGTSVVSSDTDQDGMADGWELSFGLDPLNAEDATADLDNDGNSNLQEFNDNTDPTDELSFKIPQISFGAYDFENQQPLAGASQASFAEASFAVANDSASSSTYSFASQVITHSQEAAVEWTIESEEGNLTFDLKTSTEGSYDYFVVYIDGNLVYSLSGENDWQSINIPVTAGVHTIIFSYEKDFIVSSGSDKVWIDNVSYTGLTFDQDSDLMPDAWEVAYGFDPLDAGDAAEDFDSDGLTNVQEYERLTNPTLADSDQDTLTDGEEVNTYLSNPLSADSDGDYIPDALEVELALNPADSADGELDLDADGFSNTLEAKYASDLNDAASMPESVGYYHATFDAELSANWNTSANDTWLIEANQNGENVLTAEPISNSKSADITYVNIFEPGTLSFNVNLDSEENMDFFQIHIDGVIAYEFSGIISQAVEIPLTGGEHSIALSYVKNNVGSSTIDRVSIDDFIFIAPDADTDNDGLSNQEELTLGTDLTLSDTDADGLSDGEEVTLGSDPLLEDTDSDGLSDSQEVTLGTDFLKADTDDDGIDDNQEVNNGTDPLVADTDADGLSDGEEATLGSDPLVADSDSDGVLDGQEVTNGTDPLVADSDADGLSDGEEAALGSDPLVTDTDSDGLSDGQEVSLGTNALKADTDDDGISDKQEVTNGTDPLKADTDNDGVNDNVDLFPLDSSRWAESGGGSVFFMIPLLFLGLLRRRVLK